MTCVECGAPIGTVLAIQHDRAVAVPEPDPHWSPRAASPSRCPACLALIAERVERLGDALAFVALMLIWVDRDGPKKGVDLSARERVTSDQDR